MLNLKTKIQIPKVSLTFIHNQSPVQGVSFSTSSTCISLPFPTGQTLAICNYS